MFHASALANRPDVIARVRCARRRGASPGFSVFEMLCSVIVVAILAAVVVPRLEPSGVQSIESVARILASDLNYARSLAIQYNTQWSVQFDPVDNHYDLVYAGGGLQPYFPVNPRGYGDAPAALYRVQVNRLGESTVGDNGVRLAGAALKTSQTNVVGVTFGPQGSLGPAQSDDAVVWFTYGSGGSMIYVRLTISWVTGQTWVDPPNGYTSIVQIFQ